MKIPELENVRAKAREKISPRFSQNCWKNWETLKALHAGINFNDSLNDWFICWLCFTVNWFILGLIVYEMSESCENNSLNFLRAQGGISRFFFFHSTDSINPNIFNLKWYKNRIKPPVLTFHELEPENVSYLCMRSDVHKSPVNQQIHKFSAIYPWQSSSITLAVLCFIGLCSSLKFKS